jgi:hypothetical protein
LWIREDGIRDLEKFVQNSAEFPLLIRALDGFPQAARWKGYGDTKTATADHPSMDGPQLHYFKTDEN